jgi:uncharacterized protein YutE (UPF0331/DUF86 family)
VTNLELVEKKLAFLERCLRELRQLADPSQVETDIRQQRFVERELQLAIQAALDVASHIVADERLAEPSTNADLFSALTRHLVIDASLGASMVRAAKFHNVLVHAYVDIDPTIVRDMLENRLGELDAYVAAVRTFVSCA